MDHFFSSVASLMSCLLRQCVDNSIQDIVALVESYGAGNDYQGVYNVMDGLGLPQLQHLVIVFLVSKWYVSFYC